MSPSVFEADKRRDYSSGGSERIGNDTADHERLLQPSENKITFSAGNLQPPFFFGNRMDDAVNCGAIGAIIEHEMIHGSDDEGRQFAAIGNLHDWWTPKDAAEYRQRAAYIAEEYSSFPGQSGVHVNGKLTLGENIADNGGGPNRIDGAAQQDRVRH